MTREIVTEKFVYVLMHCANHLGVRDQCQIKGEMVNTTFVYLVILRGQRTKFVFAVFQSPRASERIQQPVAILVFFLHLLDFKMGQFERDAQPTDERVRIRRDYFRSW